MSEKKFRPTSKVIRCVFCGHSFDIFGHVRAIASPEGEKRVARCPLCKRDNAVEPAPAEPA